VIVLRGRRAEPGPDRTVTRDLASRVARTGEPAVRVWYPPCQVVFGRRDRAADGYERAKRAAESRGYPTTVRETGGRAVAFTGDVLALARAESVDAAVTGTDERYERALADLESALAELGVAAERGEPPDSFCPGTRSLSAGGKLVGLAQRVRAEVAVVGGLVVVRDGAAIAAVLDPVYEALDLPFDPASAGSLDGAGGETDRDGARATVEDALVGDAAATVRRVRET
jgi:lipoate-protein ligase A